MSPSPSRTSPALRALHAGLAVVAAAAAAGALGGCSSGPAGSPSPPPSRTPASSSPSASATGPAVLDERARGTTVRVSPGTLVVVRLHGAYWSTPVGSDPRVLTPAGGGTSVSATCPPGRGCGTSSARFTALRPGTAHITARRAACGEAMRCPPGQGRYDVTVTVT
ncbi:hypothetical protein BIV25_34140 [Streptomyces sp. MUSC 14]|uniref:hypothetical protein n=1 Tax=Streptomyces sp. MUSC 14 TaxID=1354889 RepID=UPI0008F5F69E|nr:hypothetical protein [Streptomyces sp. MUSC 14]OIJ89490.1 hypothetical protein BIV25_34140 [Streptomyces sp. MUSC 14]